MEDKSLSIIIVNWNTNDRLLQCLDSIGHAGRNGINRLEVIVVDNASRIRRRPEKTDSFPLIWIQNTKNHGFAKACNQGALAAQGNYLLFLNPDTRIRKDTLEISVREYERIKNSRTSKRLFAAARSKRDNLLRCDLPGEGMTDIGALGVQITDEKGTVQRTCSRLPKLRYYAAKAFGLNQIVPSWDLFQKDWDHKDSRFVEEIMGAFFFMERSRFQELGGFDERFFMYYEEVDLCKRLQDSGCGIYYTTETSIYHEAGAASGQVKGKRLFYELRSRYLYFEKHFTRTAAAMLVLLMRQEQLVRNGKAIFNAEIREEINNAFFKFYKWKREESAGKIKTDIN